MTRSPTLSGSAVLADDEPIVISADRDPADRSADRLLAALGLFEDVVPLFRDGEHVCQKVWKFDPSNK